MSSISNNNNDQSKYVKIVSGDGQEFYLQRNVAMGSKTIATMLDGHFREARDNLIRFPDIESYILERVVKYLHYKAQYTNASTRIPDFIIEPETALELLIASKYLDC